MSTPTLALNISVPQVATNALPAHVADPTSHKIWAAILKGAKQIVVHGLTVLNPKEEKEPVPSDGSQSSPAAATPSTGSNLPSVEGFVLTGDIVLFKNPKLEATYRSWHGPTPLHLTGKTRRPAFQHVSLKNSCLVSDVFPHVAAPVLSGIELDSVLLTYQNCTFDDKKAAGYTLDAQITLVDKIEKVYSLLSKVLKLDPKHLTYPVHVALPAGVSWLNAPLINDLCLEGALPLGSTTLTTPDSAGVQLSDGITLHNAGIRLKNSAGVDGKSALEWEVYGELSLVVPGSTTPLVLDYSITEGDKNVTLTAQLPQSWTNAFGTGLTLDSVKFVADFSLDGPLKSLNGTLTANLNAGNASTSFVGTYTPSGDWSFKASIPKFDFDVLSALFKHLRDGDISKPPQTDISMGSATLEIAKKADDKSATFTISLEHVGFDGYSAQDANLQVTSSGVIIKADAGSISFKEIVLESAFLQVTFASTQGTSLSSDVFIGGKFTFHGCSGLEFDAVAHLYEDSHGTLQHTVYGTIGEKSLAIGNVFPTLKGKPFGGIIVSDLLFAVASCDDPAASAMNPKQHKISQGIQIYAAFDSIPGFNQLIRSKDKGSPVLTLCANWFRDQEGGEEFKLNILLPSQLSLHLGRGVTTDPINIALQIDKSFAFVISGGVSVPISSQADPLHFTMDLALIAGQNSLPDVQFHADMTNYWNDPFGISKDLSLGDVNLGLDINLETFFETGLPSGFNVGAGLKLLDATLKFKLDIDEDPKRELLCTSVDNLSVQDVEKFFDDLIGVKLPNIPNFLTIMSAKMYASTGVTIGADTYPAGFSFDAEILFCGAELTAKALKANDTLNISGSLTNFNVGPFAVKGFNNTPTATVDLVLGASEQKATINGQIDFLELYDVGLLLNLEMKPKPALAFDFILQFTPMLTFSVDATMIGDIKDFGELSKADFDLKATFEQHLLDYIRDHTLQTLNAAKQAADAKLTSAEEDAKKEQEAYNAKIQTLEDALAKKKAAWESRQQQAKADATKKCDDQNLVIKAAQDKVAQEEQAFNNKIKSAEGAVQLADANRKAKLQEANAKITAAQTQWNNDVAAAELELHNAQAFLSSKFGHAEQDLTNAENKVNGLQNQINDIQNKINDYSHASRFQIWKKVAIPGLEVERGALYAAKAIADAALNACKAIITGTEYATAKGVISGAEAAVAKAGVDGQGILAGLKNELIKIDADTARVLAGVNTALQELQKTGDATLTLAQASLTKVMQEGLAIAQEAQKLLDDVAKGAEWLEYQAAQVALKTLQDAALAASLVATKALEAAKLVEDGAIDVAKFAVDAISFIQVTEVQLTATLQNLSKDNKFGASISLEVEGKPIGPLNIDFDLKSPEAMLKGVFDSVVDHLKKKL